MIENPSTDPSCTADDGVTILQEQVLELLEMARIPILHCDRIMEMIALGELAREKELQS